MVCPLSLMSKGESVLVLLLPSSQKGEIVCIMIQVLSLMATQLDDSSQCSSKGLQIKLQRMNKERYMQVNFVQESYTHKLIEQN